MASSTTAFTLKDAGFYVKNVPSTFTEWDLFHIFAKFGFVGYCRVAGTPAADKNALFGFVNMLSVEGADEVRKSLKNGNLCGESYSLQVSDVKTGTTSTSVARPSPAIRIPSMWLPLHEEIEVDIVNHLPCSSIDESTFSLTIRRVDDPTIEATYNALNEKLSQWANLPKFEGEPQIGYDCAYKESIKTIRRARRISPTKLYLMDEGTIVDYDKTKCFAIPSKFIYLPMKVALCSLDGLTWTKGTVSSFDKIRAVIKQWHKIEGTNLQAKTFGYSGSLNLISLYCKQSFLADRLQRKGICEYHPRSAVSERQYSREQLLKCKNSKSVSNMSTDEDVLKDLVIGMQQVSTN